MAHGRIYGDSGYIKLYRSITEWRWYSDPVMFRVFVHLLLTANYEPHDWRDITVWRGQRVTSVSHLANELGLSRETVRYALKRLANGGEITTAATNRYTIITLKNYDRYQGNSEQIAAPPQTDGKPIADRIGTIKEVKEEKEKKEGEESTDEPTANAFSSGFNLQKPSADSAPQCKGKAYSPEDGQPTEKSLVERYGADVVRRYEQRFESWSRRKGAVLPLYRTIAAWIEKDCVKPLCEGKRTSTAPSAELTGYTRTELSTAESA